MNCSKRVIQTLLVPFLEIRVQTYVHTLILRHLFLSLPQALIRGKGSGTATPFGGVAGKKGGGGNLPQGGPGQESEANGILEGISSLHSWIKTQTMIRPTPKISRGKLSGTYEEVGSRGPCCSQSREQCRVIVGIFFRSTEL